MRLRPQEAYTPAENRETVTPLARFPASHARGAEFRQRK